LTPHIQWEYLTQWVDPMVADGEDSLAEVLGSAGSECWELVSATADAWKGSETSKCATQMLLIFKRQCERRSHS
jgi:hypothetical protein